MPADNADAVDELLKRGQRGGNKGGVPGRRPGLPGPKKPPATPPTGEQEPKVDTTAGNDDQRQDTPPPPVVPAVPVASGQETAAPAAPAVPEPVPTPPVPVPVAAKSVSDQQKRKAKPRPVPVPEHRVSWNPEARQIRAELLGWCAARTKAAKRAADVARVLRKTAGDVSTDDLRAIVVEVAQRTGQSVEDVATVAGFTVD